VQAKAWIDEALMLEWIAKVWKPHNAMYGNPLTYLLLDECTVHKMEPVKEAFLNCNTHVDLFPGGYTGRLQPMDVGCNKPFKDYLTEEFDDWLIDNMNKKPKRTDVSGWIE
jgi:hypothetical protein